MPKSDRLDVVAALGAVDVQPRGCLDRAGAAVYLGGVSDDTVDRLIHAGELPIIRLPAERHKKTGRGVRGTTRRILISIRDLDALIERSRERRT